MTSTAAVPLPAGMRLAADPSLRRRDDGRLLIGGSPLRFVRVTAAGAATVSGWLRGERVGSGAGSTALARRLMAAGMVQPVSPASGGDSEPGVEAVTVVIPVKDDAEGLQTTLVGLPSTVPVVIVDDGSAIPIAPGCDLPNAPASTSVVRRPDAGGPGVARQRGLAYVSTPLVAFVDAGVTLDPDVLSELGRWFADPDVVAVGPRVACTDGDDALSRYERFRSPLDLGPTPAAIGPESTVTYLPTACLMTRTAAVAEVGGFDPDLRWGEDVDLVWRLGELGTVRYDPSLVVHHPARPTLRAFVRQRVGYGSAAGPLARRHGSRLAPLRMSGWSLGCWALAFTGRPALGALVAGGTAVALKRKLAPILPDAGVESALLAGRGHWYAGRAIAAATTRAWWPLTALAGLLGARRTAARLVALSLLDRVFRSPASGRDRALDLALGVVDDAAYGTGVWLGSITSHSLRALAPKLAEWPPDDEP